MYSFVVDIAKKKIGMETLCRRMQLLSRAYLCEGPADFVLQSSMDDLLAEEQIYLREYPGAEPYDSLLETFVMQRKVAERMLDYDTFLMHGAVIDAGDGAILFTARSGTGKTTHTRLWLKNVPGAYVVNGDKPLIIAGETPLACGTPWCGKERMGTNAIVPLKAIVFMHRAEENAMRPVAFAEAFPRLLEQTHRPEAPEKLRKTVQLLSSLNKRVALWRFDFNNYRDDAFAVAHRALTGRGV